MAKDRVTAAVLAILLGIFGVHKFYLGQVGLGILYLAFFWTFIPAIVGLIEGIVYLATDEATWRAKHGGAIAYAAPPPVYATAGPPDAPAQAYVPAQPAYHAPAPYAPVPYAPVARPMGIPCPRCAGYVDASSVRCPRCMQPMR